MNHGTVEWRGNDGSPIFAIKAHPHVIVRIKRLFPRASPYQAGWVVVSETPEVGRDLLWLLERYPMDMDAVTRLRLGARAEEHRRTEKLVEEILAGSYEGRNGYRTPAREPRDYQVVAADLAAATGRLLLLDAVGLGKSMSGLLTLRDMNLLPAVVVCYPHLERQWAREVTSTFPELRVHAVTSMEPYDPVERRGGKRPDVLIVPWSKLRGWGHHLTGQARTVIFDEAQELRTGTSQKYAAACEVARSAIVRIELTATPVYNYGGEIFNVVNVIAPDVLGTRSEFIREWCGVDEEQAGADRNARVRDPAGLGIYLREQGVMLRRTRREVGRELPATVRVPQEVDLDARILDSDADVVDLADAVLSKQIGSRERFLAAGELDWKLRRLTGLAKAPYVAAYVEALLEDDDDKVVLYGWHRDVYSQWRMRLARHSPVWYTGSESKAAKGRSFDEFVHGDSRILIVSLRAGAGLEGLQGASHTCVFGELDWSPGVHEQAIGRLARDGMGEHVTAFFLYCMAGSDPVIMETLALKQSQSEPLIDPDADPFTPVKHDESRVRRLAEAVRNRRR